MVKDGWVRGVLTQRGASFFLVPSMDAGSWTDRQHEQHARLFRHRAAESGRWFAVAATSGVSQIVDPQGRVRGRLPTMEDGVLLGSVVPRTEQTLYRLDHSRRRGAEPLSASGLLEG